MTRSNGVNPFIRARCIVAHEFGHAALLVPSVDPGDFLEGSYGGEISSLIGAARRRRRAATAEVVDIKPDGSLVCPAPGCGPAVWKLARLGHDARFAALWLHVGPIEKQTTPVTIHGGREPGPLPRTFTIATPSAYRAYLGYTLDQIALVERPPETECDVIARPLPSSERTIRAAERPLFVVYATARLDEGGPGARWVAPRGQPAYSNAEHLRATMPDEDWAAYLKALALITGHVGKGNGRPALTLSDPEKAVVIQAEALYLRYERRVSYGQIAATLGYNERRLRSFRERARTLGFYETDEYRQGIAKELRKHGSP